VGTIVGRRIFVRFLQIFDSWRLLIASLDRHPTRQGTLLEEQYKMQHDIYSVGIVLLEIGLWASLVSYQGADTDNATAAPSTLLAPLLVRPPVD
jgi:hypothetical protein